MEFLLHLFKLYPGLISSLVQSIIYIGSAILFFNALWLIFRAYKHIRYIGRNQLRKKSSTEPYLDDPLMVLTAKTYFSAMVEHDSSSYPESFIADATKQLVENMFHTKYINKITMITNLLPPMGFIGTIFGMIMIFLAQNDPNSDLNTTGLGAALFTTLIALSCFVILEIIKKNLINLSGSRIEMALAIRSNIKIPEK
jgi:flagellar motor component MotA